jgi:hypothetical protein
VILEVASMEPKTVYSWSPGIMPSESWSTSANWSARGGAGRSAPKYGDVAVFRPPGVGEAEAGADDGDMPGPIFVDSKE